MTDTPFEQAVAEALLAVRIPSSAGMLHLDVRDVVALAPRVAAAIDRGIAHAAHIALTGATDFAPAWDGALAALRGTPAP